MLCYFTFLSSNNWFFVCRSDFLWWRHFCLLWWGNFSLFRWRDKDFLWWRHFCLLWSNLNSFCNRMFILLCFFLFDRCFRGHLWYLTIFANKIDCWNVILSVSNNAFWLNIFNTSKLLWLCLLFCDHFVWGHACIPLSNFNIVFNMALLGFFNGVFNFIISIMLKTNVFYISKTSNWFSVRPQLLQMNDLSFNMILISSRLSGILYVFNLIFVYNRFVTFNFNIFNEFKISMAFMLEIYVLSRFSA
jgi:hypothetical protein